MIKLRNAQYCNLKLFLIILVIYGHLIEPYIWQSDLLMIQYRLIYLIHMPLFSFLSGLFLNSAKACLNQLLKTLPMYIILQSLAVILNGGNVKVLTPFWHLWYLLSYCIWLATAWLWFKICNGKGKIIILILSIVIGCACGLIPFVNRIFSLSRTLVFLPYFWLGLMCKPNFDLKRLRSAGAVSLAIFTVIMACGGDKIPIVFLYHAEPFGDAENGVLLRLICYLLGGLMGLFLLSFTPTNRYFFTKLGANTMPAYLIHAPIVLLIREFSVLRQFYIIITVGIIYAVYMLTCWHSDLYGIIPTERRCGRWLPLKKYMKNTQSTSTVFY